jgi:hypothetical protein
MADGPHVRLAHNPGGQGDNVLAGRMASEDRLPEESAPSLLLSYHYYAGCADIIRDYVHRDWVLDSGAFSAMNSGAEIDLDAYIEFCKEVLSGPDPPVEIFALDVIGDAEGTKRNTERMWEAGIEAIPAYHIGEPEQYLLDYAATYPKIALGGVARVKGSLKHGWAKECFARVWPKKVHGFGFGTERGVLGLPFHSTDSTNWELGPCRFGVWRSYSGGARAFVKLNVRGSGHNLQGEVEWYLKLEQRARTKWRAQMEELDALDEPCPSERLAIVALRPPSRISAAFTRKEATS